MIGGMDMKYNKKTITIAVFILGAVILMTSAFADMILGSGYNSLKSSMKTTAAKLTDEVDNFTVNATLALKLDGVVVEETVSNGKFDIANNTRESEDKRTGKGKTSEGYWYSNGNQRIYRNDDGSYSVIERRKKTHDEDMDIIKNPFEDEQFKDAEKIADAFVGSLQDIIQLEESNGRKMYIGNLTETEIPSIVNAISSFAFKYGILDQWQAKHLGVPRPMSNIYLISAMGKAIENENGILESGIFTASISAEDSDGIEHIYSFDFSMDIKDINTTIVKAPNLEGQKVTYTKEGFEFDNKYLGKYKNDIVIEKDNTFKKVGERFVEINSIDKGNLKGKYYEIYNEGYEADDIRNFDFYSSYDDSPYYYTVIQYKDNDGKIKEGVIHRNSLQNIDISFDVEMHEEGGYSYRNNVDGFDNNFIRIFD